MIKELNIKRENEDHEL